jgi:ComEC/Rec2-related protein
MQEKKTRLFNYRPVCFFALFLSLGIAVGEAMSPLNPYYRFIPLGIIVLATAAFFVFPKVRQLAFLPIAVLAGFIAINASNDLFASKTLAQVYTGTLSAKVASEIILEGGRTAFYVEDIRIKAAKGEDGEKLENLSLGGKSYVLLYEDGDIDFGAGDIVEIKCKISSNYHEPFDSYYAYEVANDYVHFISAYSVEKLADGVTGYPLNLQLAVKRLYYENTDGFTSVICQALLIGDKRGIDDEMYADIQTSGLAHVLAVSGTHITALATVLFFVLKKIKIQPKAAFFLVTGLTFLYVMLCGFVASAVRSLIMSAVFNFSFAFGFKNDNLSSLAFACALILLFSPTALFDVGFLLSVFAVLGIFMFYAPFTKACMRVVEKASPRLKIGQYAVKSASVSIASNITTYPLVAYYFKAVPTLFIISNLLMLPYMMAVFIALLLITVFAMVTGLSGAVGVMYYVLLPFKAFVGAIGSVSFASVDADTSVVGIFMFVFCALVASRFVFLRKSVKIKVILSALSLWVALYAATL